MISMLICEFRLIRLDIFLNKLTLHNQFLLMLSALQNFVVTMFQLCDYDKIKLSVSDLARKGHGGSTAPQTAVLPPNQIHLKFF